MFRDYLDTALAQAYGLFDCCLSRYRSVAEQWLRQRRVRREDVAQLFPIIPGPMSNSIGTFRDFKGVLRTSMDFPFAGFNEVA